MGLRLILSFGGPFCILVVFELASWLLRCMTVHEMACEEVGPWQVGKTMEQNGWRRQQGKHAIETAKG